MFDWLTYNGRLDVKYARRRIQQHMPLHEQITVDDVTCAIKYYTSTLTVFLHLPYSSDSK